MQRLARKGYRLRRFKYFGFSEEVSVLLFGSDSAFLLALRACW